MYAHHHSAKPPLLPRVVIAGGVGHLIYVGEGCFSFQRDGDAVLKSLGYRIKLEKMPALR